MIIEMHDEWQRCESCRGAGVYSIGDCEEGLDEICFECEGLGEVIA